MNMTTASPRPLAVITGASSGIGRQIAIGLAEDGFDIVVDHYRDADGAEATLAAVRDAGGSGWTQDADVGSAAELDILFERVANSGQRLTVLINNAAIQTFASLIDLAEADFDRTIRTNLKGTFLCTQRAARLMRTTGSPTQLDCSIINIGSGANQNAFPKLGDYCASKGGIEMLTKVAAVELGPDRIRVNCIAPGAIENERTRAESPDYGKTWGALAPLGRVGSEQDIAYMARYLVSPRASFITGQTMFVDGGLWTQHEWPYED